VRNEKKWRSEDWPPAAARAVNKKISRKGAKAPRRTLKIRTSFLSLRLCGNLIDYLGAVS